MASNKRILNWKIYSSKRNGGRWAKYIPELGKTKYFGSASSKLDPKAYKAAECAYFDFVSNVVNKQPVEIISSKTTLRDAAEEFMQQ